MVPLEQFEIHPFTAADGFQLNCWRYHGPDTSKGPVLLVHGAGVRANLFNPPIENNLIEMLAAAGYDVWLENWRASIEFPESQWTLDEAAINDHPEAVKLVCKVTGAKEIKAIIHCQGSTSFMISAALGLVPQVETIVSNAVSLHPVVSNYAKFKLNYFIPPVAALTDYFNPQWGRSAPNIFPKIMKWFVKLTHWENDTTVGKFVSFTYGGGWPTLWQLENLDEKTKNWIQEEFAAVPISFFYNIRESIKKGALSPFGKRGTYADKPPKTDARFVFFAGQLNKCFKFESQVNSYKYFKRLQSGKHALHILPNYSHLDVFFGKNANTEVFPLMIEELGK